MAGQRKRRPGPMLVGECDGYVKDAVCAHVCVGGGNRL